MFYQNRNNTLFWVRFVKLVPTKMYGEFTVHLKTAEQSGGAGQKKTFSYSCRVGKTGGIPALRVRF